MTEPPIALLDRPREEQGKTRVRPLVRVENVAKYYPVQRSLFSKPTFLRAVDGVTFHIRKGETLGLVGESGCGKSTLGRTILRLQEPTYGRIIYDDHDLTTMKGKDLRRLRARMQIVFQDPHAALNPKLSVRTSVAEGLRVHKLTHNAKEEEARVAELLDRVGLPKEAMHRYPHEFSSGQRQRIGIARALAVRPDFIVCDEPVSALDVSVQAQIINLFRDLQDELGLSYLFISHDLRVVQYVSRRIAVMYLGKMVEIGKTPDLLEKRHHPYTRALFAAVPTPRAGRHRLRVVMDGDVPSPLDPPSGCAFHPRCPRAQIGKCDKETPPLEELTPGSHHQVACFFPER